MRANLIRTLLAGLVTLGLVGCYGATPYQPKERGYGYSEQKLEDNRYRVTFAGNSMTERETVENYLLYRAAELTLENGFDHFVLTSQDTGTETRYQQTLSGYYGFGHYYWYPAVAVSSSRPETSYEAQAYIVMYKGTKREGDTKSFDARALKANLEDKVARPQPK